MRFSIRRESTLILKNLNVKNKLYFLLSFCSKFSIINNSSISFQLKHSSKVELSKSLMFIKLIF